MTLTIMIVLLTLVLWTLLPAPKNDTTPVRNHSTDDKLR